MCPSKVLFEEPERVLDIEAAAEHRPPVINFVRGVRDGLRDPQPDGFRGPVTGQPLDPETDETALDDRGRPVMVRPCPTGFEFRMHPTKGAGPGVTTGESLRL